MESLTGSRLFCVESYRLLRRLFAIVKVQVLLKLVLLFFAIEIRCIYSVQIVEQKSSNYGATLQSRRQSSRLRGAKRLSGEVKV